MDNETRQEFQKIHKCIGEFRKEVSERFDKLEADVANGFEKIDGQLHGISARIEAIEKGW